MTRSSNWLARGALLTTSLGMVVVISGLLDASGLASAGLLGAQPTPSGSESSSGPSPTVSCMVPIPPPLPTPSPICVASTPSPTASETPTPSPSASPSESPSEVKEKPSKLALAYKTKLKSFVGTVDSVKRCERGRRVILRRAREGRDATLGEATTDKSGAYTLKQKQPTKGRYYAEVLSDPVGKYGVLFVCSRAHSKTINIE